MSKKILKLQKLTIIMRFSGSAHNTKLIIKPPSERKMPQPRLERTRFVARRPAWRLMKENSDGRRITSCNGRCKPPNISLSPKRCWRLEARLYFAREDAGQLPSLLHPLHRSVPFLAASCNLVFLHSGRQNWLRDTQESTFDGWHQYTHGISTEVEN